MLLINRTKILIGSRIEEPFKNKELRMQCFLAFYYFRALFKDVLRGLYKSLYIAVMRFQAV